MNTPFFTVLLLAGLFMVSSVQTYQLSHKDKIAVANLMRRRDRNISYVESKDKYINLLSGLFRSGNLLRDAADIPCSIIQTLETNGDEAKLFVDQIRQGNVPTIIKDLPQEITGAISNIVDYALKLPTEIKGAAEAAVTDAERVFNDIERGDIEDLGSFPGVVVSDLEAGFSDFTAELVNVATMGFHAFACLFENCPPVTSTPATAPACTPASTFSIIPTQDIIPIVTPRTGPMYSIVPTGSAPGAPHSYSNTTYLTTGVPASRTGEPPVTNLGVKTGSSPFESSATKLCAIAFLAVVGVAILL